MTDPPAPAPTPVINPVRVCPKCSTQSDAGGDFCPHCGARYAKRKRSKKVRAFIFGGPVIAVLAAAAVAVVLVVHHNNQVAARKHAAAVAAVAARKKAKAAELLREIAADDKRLKREEAQAARRARNAARQRLVNSLAAAVKKTAIKDVADDVLDGPILKVQCDPASATDATANIGTYSCLAATSQTGTTLNGYNFVGTINLNTGDITWRLGNS
jgi:predicted nucleic acid-binding Zn ribbon protein